MEVSKTTRMPYIQSHGLKRRRKKSYGEKYWSSN